MTTTDHPSGLPEQEPASPTVAVLCGGEAWIKTGADWESPGHLYSWDGLRNRAAERGGATLFDLADLPTRMGGAHAVAVVDGVTHSGSVEVRRDPFDYPNLAIGDAVAPKTGVDCCLWSKAFTGKYSMILGGVKIAPYGEPGPWLRGDELEAIMPTLKEGDVVEVSDKRGHTASGELWAFGSNGLSLGSTFVHWSDDKPGPDVDALRIIERAPEPKPKPVDPTGGDPVVRASLVAFVAYKKCIFFRAQDGLWSRECGSERGMWGTDELAEIGRLSAQTIAELMGGER